MTLEAVRRFCVPKEVVAGTDDLLRKAGAEQLEIFVLWTGIPSNDQFEIRSVRLPSQTSYKLAEGLCVRVDGEELHRLNLALYEQGEILAIQIHTHPEEAYHSETDDTYPIVTQLGGLSIVVPNFGAAGTGGPGTATYRLGSKGWIDIPRRSAVRLLGFGA
jgi:hypothetical protein